MIRKSLEHAESSSYGNPDVGLPGKFSKTRLITSNDPLLKLARFQRLNPTHWPRRSQAIKAIHTEVRLLDEELLLHLVVLVLVQLLLGHDRRWRRLKTVDVRDTRRSHSYRAEWVITARWGLAVAARKIAELLLRAGSRHSYCTNWRDFYGIFLKVVNHEEYLAMHHPHQKD